MDKKMLQDTFKEYKKAAAKFGVDFAISSPASFDSSTVMNKIIDKYGHDYKGVWANRVEDMEEETSVFVNHSLDEVQVGIFYSIFGKNYNIIPEERDFSDTWAFELFEKNTPVWQIHMVGEKPTPHGVTADRKTAERRLGELGTVVQRIW